MEEQNNNYRSSEEREMRKNALLELKKEILALTDRHQMNDFNGEPENQVFNSTENSGVDNTRGHSKVKATTAGRLMNDKDYGYVNALMLGLISFIMEILFLGIAFLLFQ